MGWAAAVPLIGGAINAIGGLIGGGADRKEQRRLNERNIQFQWDMWRATNMYNAPLEQRKRMEAGGFNPALMYEGSPQNTTSAMNLPDMQRGPDRNYGDAGASIAMGAMQTAQLANTEAQTRTTETQANLNEKHGAAVDQGMLKTAAEIGMIQQSTAKTAQDIKRGDLLMESSVEAAQLEVDQRRQKLAMENINMATLSDRNRAALTESLMRIANAEKEGTLRDLKIIEQQEINRLRSLGIENAPYYIRVMSKLGDELEPLRVAGKGAIITTHGLINAARSYLPKRRKK